MGDVKQEREHKPREYKNPKDLPEQPEWKQWNLSTFEVGDVFDCRDELGKWNLGKISSKSGTKLRINYKGWGSKFDEEFYIGTDDYRIAPPNTNTRTDIKVPSAPPGTQVKVFTQKDKSLDAEWRNGTILTLEGCQVHVEIEAPRTPKNTLRRWFHLCGPDILTSDLKRFTDSDPQPAPFPDTLNWKLPTDPNHPHQDPPSSSSRSSGGGGAGLAPISTYPPFHSSASSSRSNFSSSLASSQLAAPFSPTDFAGIGDFGDNFPTHSERDTRPRVDDPLFDLQWPLQQVIQVRADPMNDNWYAAEIVDRSSPEIRVKPLTESFREKTVWIDVNKDSKRLRPLGEEKIAYAGAPICPQCLTLTPNLPPPPNNTCPICLALQKSKNDGELKEGAPPPAQEEEEDKKISEMESNAPITSIMEKLKKEVSRVKPAEKLHIDIFLYDLLCTTNEKNDATHFLKMPEPRNPPWVCITCTYENSHDRTVCFMCERARPRHFENLADWYCSKCSIWNTGTNARCKRCHFQKFSSSDEALRQVIRGEAKKKARIEEKEEFDQKGAPSPMSSSSSSSASSSPLPVSHRTPLVEKPQNAHAVSVREEIRTRKELQKSALQLYCNFTGDKHTVPPDRKARDDTKVFGLNHQFAFLMGTHKKIGKDCAIFMFYKDGNFEPILLHQIFSYVMQFKLPKPRKFLDSELDLIWACTNHLRAELDWDYCTIHIDRLLERCFHPWCRDNIPSGIIAELRKGFQKYLAKKKERDELKLRVFKKFIYLFLTSWYSRMEDRKLVGNPINNDFIQRAASIPFSPSTNHHFMAALSCKLVLKQEKLKEQQGELIKEPEDEDTQMEDEEKTGGGGGGEEELSMEDFGDDEGEDNEFPEDDYELDSGKGTGKSKKKSVDDSDGDGWG